MAGDGTAGQADGVGVGAEAVGVGAGVVGTGVGVGVAAGVIGVGVAADVDGADEGCGAEEPTGPGAGNPEANGFGAWPVPVSGTGSSPRFVGLSTPGSGGSTRWCLCRPRLTGPSSSGEIAVAAGGGLLLARTVFTADACGACAESAVSR